MLPSALSELCAFAAMDESWLLSRKALLFTAAVASGGVVLGFQLARRLTVPFDADRYMPLTAPGERLLRGALGMCERIKDHTTRCYFKGRIREMVRLEPICDEAEFAKMSKDLSAEIDDCLHFGTCFRFGGPKVSWDVSRLPRGPPGLLAGAEMVTDIKRMHRVLCRLSKRYGKVFPMQLEGNPLWVVVSGPKEAKAIFHDNGATVSSRSFGQGHLITHTDFPAGNFLRCPFSEDLKKRRGVVWREALSKQKVEMFRPILEHCRHLSLRAFANASQGGAEFDPRPLLRMTYLNTLACILFGISFTGPEDPEYRRVYECIDDEANEPLFGEADAVPLMRFTPLYSKKAARMKHIRARQDKWLHEKIGARQQHLAEGNPPQTLCDILLSTMTSPCPGQRMSYENIKEICNEVIFAGTDTTATTTETVLAHLLNNPEKADKLRAELDSVFGDGQHLPTAADFPKLKYMNSAIKEAMRLTCAVPFNAHTCSEDTEVMGYRIPKGAMCINNIYAVHYDPEIYPDPESFVPERWLDKDPCRWSVENDFEFMPFGIGRRLCLGYNLALENLQLFVASLFSSFEFSSATGRPVSMVEETDFTVSVPSFKVRAGVRATGAVGKQTERFLALPVLELTQLGAKAAETDEHPATAAPAVQQAGSRESWAVWYGSQTGTAENFAKDLARAARRRGVDCNLRSLEKAKDNLRPEGEDKAIFFVATYGNGEPTDSTVDFHARLKRGSIDAKDLRFAVFGLGNSEYEHYNAMGRCLDSRFEQLGGSRLAPLGLGDASKDIDGAFEDWMTQLLDAQAPLESSFEPEQTKADVGPHQAPPSAAWRVFWQSAKSGASALQQRSDKAPPVGSGRSDAAVAPTARAAAEDACLARVQDVRELSKKPEVAGSIIEVTLDIAGQGLSYETADTIGVYPRNDPEAVERMGALLNQPLDAAFALVPAAPQAEEELPFPSPTTLREVLSSSTDLLGKPSKRAVGALAKLCGDPGEREALERLASPAGRAQWQELADQGALSLLALYSAHPSLADAPLAAFLELVPSMRLKPRFYTASSCPGAIGGDLVKLTVKVVGEAGPAAPSFGGVCSSFLAGAVAGDPVKLFVQPSGFALPADPAVPVVMVATGTGLAPFRGFLEQRRLFLEEGHALGQATLLFGCTKPEVDFICEDELKRHLEEGSLNRLVTAFSRQDPQRKLYVQHRLAEEAASVREALLSGRGHFYVCGGTAMGRAVKEALINVLAEDVTLSGRAEAERYVAQMEEDRRFVAELWA